MKQKMKTIFKVFALILLITFSSCNEDLYESQTQQSESKFQIKELSKSEIELNLKLSQELNQIQNFKSKIVASKMVYDPVYDFFVNTDEALYISDGVSESYTFPVYRAASNSSLENLVIHIQNEQTLVYLVDYGYSYSEIRSMDKQELEQIDLKHYLIDFDSDILNNRVAMAQYVCIETIALNPLYGNCTEPHSNGETCNQQQFIVQSSFCQWVYDDSGNGGDGSTGGTGEPLDYSGGAGNTGNISSSTSTINTIPMGCSTCPEFSLELEEFLGTLDADQLAIWNNLLPKEQQDIIKYLVQNNYSPDTLDDVYFILDYENDGLIDDEIVIIGPDIPIYNMEDYLSCFDRSQGARITIYADQPKSNTHNLYSSNDGVGHAFFSIQQGSEIATLGFYPVSSMGSLFGATSGIFGNDQNHSYDVSISISINSSSLNEIFDMLILTSNPIYDLHQYNCTDVAVVISNFADINIPSCESPSTWNGDTPGTMGQIIRNMTISSNITRNVLGGNSPSNNCN